MARVIGGIVALLSSFGFLYTFFVYQNTSAHLAYLPGERKMHLIETGTLLPFALFAVGMIAGFTILFNAREANQDAKN